MQKFKTQIGVGCADITEQAKKYVAEVLETTRLSYGPFHQKFEQAFAEEHHRKFAMFCNSGTSALQVAVAALKEAGRWSDGDEIIVPALTFVASSNVIMQNNLKPVFVDIDPVTYNIDPSKIEAAITEKTKAIMPVHLFGLPCDMDAVMEIATKHNLKVIEDSCETMFVSAQGHKVGSRGDIACFSTYVAHLLVTGVGGLACTNDPELAVIMKSALNHGRDSIYLSIDDDKNTDSSQSLFNIVNKRFTFERMGYSYRATEMEAALGLAQIERREHILSSRQSNAKKLTEGLKDLNEYIQLPTKPEGYDHAFMMYPIVLKPQVSRDELILFLEELNIETRYMVPLINQPFYLEIFGDQSEVFPNATVVNNQGFYIGTHQALTDEEIDFMIQAFHEFFKKKQDG